MAVELALTPGGRLVVRTSDDRSDSEMAGGDAAAARAFEDGTEAGLFALAARRNRGSLSPVFAYWRDFAGSYLTRLCRVAESADGGVEGIAPPSPGELDSFVLGAPPMPGAEYISPSVLEGMWRDLDAWVHEEMESTDAGLGGFLEERAPHWHQVGRVCFHLAENRHDAEYPFAFLATYATGMKAGSGQVQYQPLSRALEEYAGARNKAALIHLLSPIQVAAESSELIREMVDSGDIYHPLAWTPSEAHAFLREVANFEESGIVVRLPDWWKKRSRPSVSVRIGERKQNAFDASSLLDFDVHLTLEGQQLSEAEWRELMEGDDGLVMLRGQWVEVDRDRLAETLAHWQQVEQEAVDGVSFIEGMRMLAGTPRDLVGDDSVDEGMAQWSFVDAGKWLRETLARLREPEYSKRVSPGKQLRATLREYQETGVNWLAFLSDLGLGACLADDMGLGKTIQVLAVLLLKKRKRDKRPSLLVLPTSLLENWNAEIARFAPSLRACFVHPSRTPKDELKAMAEAPDDALRDVDVVLTTYGMLPRQVWLLDVEWRMVVLDEAQAIKNPASRQSKTVKRLKAASRIALTGTPVENRLGDLWSLFDFLCPGLLGSQGTFKQFIKGLENREHDRYAPLRRLVSPYILRRLKTDKRVISDLPDKTEVRAFCGLSKRQASGYQTLVKELSRALEGEGGIKRKGVVLAYLTRFKQICNHPAQLSGDGDYAPDQSGKFERLREICDEVASRQEKVLVFTQFREMTEPLAEFLAEVFGRSGVVLHGGTPAKRRQALVDEFQREDGPPFFILSLKAGGTGLNLTAASHVIHFDRWWNPAVENQATDRAFRIGQKRNVLVHKFVCRGTVEEKIDKLIEEKQQLATDLLEGGGEKLLTEMSDSELIELVSLDVERIN